MLAIIMGAPTYKIRNRDASMLLNYGFSLFERKELISQDSDVSDFQFGNNKDNVVILKAKQSLNVVVEKGKELKISTKLNIDKDRKSIRQGEVLGEAIVLVDGKEVGKIEVYSDRDLKINSLVDKFLGFFKGDSVDPEVAQ